MTVRAAPHPFHCEPCGRIVPRKRFDIAAACCLDCGEKFRRAAAMDRAAQHEQDSSLFEMPEVSLPDEPAKSLDTMPAPFAEHWHVQGTGRVPAAADGECLLCGRPVVEARCVWVEMTEANDLVRHDAPGRTPGSLGLYPVGRTCAKRVPKAYRHKRAAKPPAKSPR